jgi:hypothetical protein
MNLKLHPVQERRLRSLAKRTRTSASAHVRAALGYYLTLSKPSREMYQTLYGRRPR